MDKDAVRAAIIERIVPVMATKNAITDESELYEDLQVWGLDFYELVGWIAETFGTDFSAMNVSKYVPGEGAGELGLLRTLTGRSPYRKCTVGDLLAAVERGRWEG